MIVVEKAEEYYLKIMSRILTDRVLPPELCIQSIDDILYSIGLCHHSVKEIPKRSVINNPVIILFVNIITLLLRIVANKTDNKLVIILTADVGYLIGIKGLLSIVFVIITMMALFSQLVYYYNHCIGVKPTFIRVIQVFSGSITPSSVGLNDSTQVKQLLKIAKWQPLLKKNNTILLPLIILFLTFVMHLNSLDLISSLIIFLYPATFYSLLVLLLLQYLIITESILYYSL